MLSRPSPHRIFAPLAFEWAVTMVPSTRAYSKSGSSDRHSKTRSNTPPFTQRRKRWKIVCTQSTKRLAFAPWSGGEDVTDLNSAVRYNNAVDQKLEQRTLVLKVGRRQAVPHASAEDLGVGRESDCLRLPLGISQKLLLLKG